MTALYIVLGIIGLIGILALTVYVRFFMPLRPKEYGFEYGYVNEDGTVRELDEDEVAYLNEEFEPADGARPYIKSRYSELTPDKKIWGFIERRRVPRKIKIQSLEDSIQLNN
jgi:hypothetical protein